MSKLAQKLSKMDAKTEARMAIVSKIVTSAWIDVGRSGLKFATSENVKEVITDVIFHIIFELRKSLNSVHWL
jgi:hypothetical protein